MKIFISVLFLFLAGAVFAQSKPEADILQLSATVFKWETTNQVDSLAKVFDNKLMVVNAAGVIQTKDQYLATLRSGNFVHNMIDVEEHTATVENGTAAVAGKGKFMVTVSGNKITLHLAYIEVFTKDNNSWKLLAIHASVLPD
jgi:hypothetical protein